MEITQTQYKVIEPVFMIIFGGVLGAVSGGTIGMVIAPLARLNPRSLAASLTRIQYARVCARDLSATCAAYCGIESAVRGIRGKDDITNHLVAAAGARRRILEHIKRYHKRCPK